MRLFSMPDVGTKHRSNTNEKLKRKVPSLLLTAFASIFAAQSAMADVFINEIHYDNSGGDTGEAVEVAGDADTDLTGWSIVLYNGNNQQSYNTVNLSGSIPNQQDGFGTLDFTISGIQNGAPDGIALVDASNNLVQFLSYEGSFTATNGVANGVTSEDIGVSEASSTLVGDSLQLGGIGSVYADFSWEEASANTFAAVNTNQIFGGGGPQVDVAPTVISSTPSNNSGVNALDTNIDVSFSESVDLANGWYAIDCNISGAHTAIVTDGPQHYSLNPDTDFDFNEVCTVTVTASLVTDVDADDPPDAMESDYVFSFSTEVDSPIRINEVDADTSGSDTLEFIELYDGGAGNTSLDGLVVVLYNGSDSQSYNSAFDLNGYSTNAEGYFLLGNELVSPTPSIIINNNGLQNGADAVAIHVGDASDYENDTPVSALGLIDAIVYDTNDSNVTSLLDVLTPNQAQKNEDDADDKDAHSNARVPDGGAALDTSVYIAQLATPLASNVTEAEIFEIQGAGMSSPFAGGYVRTLSNVVTALDTNGFFMQTPEARSDLDENTSDGVYVFTGSLPTVVVGDMVDVEGQLIEFFGFTEYSRPLVSITSSGHALPAMVTFDANLPSPIQPQMENEVERFEGMIITFDGIASAATGRFGDTAVVAGDARAFRGPGIEFPGETGLPVWDGNPEIFEVDPNALGGDNPSIFAGQSVSATGPLGFSFGDYQVWPTELTLGEQPDLLVKVRDRADAEMIVGSLNMYRLFDNVDDGTGDEVIDADEYAIRLSKISRYVLNVMNAPDILAVSEVESISVLDTLAAEIEARDPSVQYTAHLQEGNDVGGIDVGFLTRSHITMDEVTQYGLDTILNFDGSLLNDRPPLLFKGRNTKDGSDFPIEVLVVHNRSLSGVDDSGRGARVRAKRMAQAQLVANLVQDIQTANPNVNLIITGDFNAYQFSDGYVDVVGQIKGTSVEADNLLWEQSPVSPELTNQVDSLPAEEQYSFIFRGSSQVLDHSLTTSNLNSMITDFGFTRGNSDVPASLVDDEADELRSSDHDGVVLFIKMDSDNDTIFDDADQCAATSIPETTPVKGLKPNYYALLDGDTIFDSVDSPYSREKRDFTIEDTAGCSCEQIAEKRGAGNVPAGALKHGCSLGLMKKWIRHVKYDEPFHG
jgi:predicted extracellular nuclease